MMVVISQFRYYRCAHLPRIFIAITRWFPSYSDVGSASMTPMMRSVSCW